MSFYDYKIHSDITKKVLTLYHLLSCPKEWDSMLQQPGQRERGKPQTTDETPQKTEK